LVVDPFEADGRTDAVSKRLRKAKPGARANT
jgi:hypothetical protein